MDLSTSNYPYKCYLESLLSYNAESKRTHMKTALFYEDGSGLEAVNVKDRGGGYDKRQAIVKDKKVIHFSTQLHIDFFNQKRYLPPGVNVKIRMIRNLDNFSIISNKDGSPYKIKLNPLMKLIVRKIQPTIELVASHKRLLNSKQAQFPFYQSRITSHLVPRGEQRVDLQSIANGGILPCQIFIVLVDHLAYSGNLKKNPFHFQNFGLRNFSFKINGENVPADSFRVDFDNGDYMRLYRNLFECIGIANDNAACGISLEEFKTGCCIIAYESSPDLCNLLHSHEGKTGVIGVNMEFKEPLANSISILSYSIYERVLFIDNDKKCTLEYQT